MIEIVPYDSRWPAEFDELRGALIEALCDAAVAVEHVGSTAVPGLPAKPILDIDVVYPLTGDFDRVRSCLESAGYVHRGDLGVPGREAFGRTGADVPSGLEARIWPRHHLYVCREDNEELRRHRVFRDSLRSNPVLASEYAELKRALAGRFAGDRQRYGEGKSRFVEGVLAEAL